MTPAKCIEDRKEHIARTLKIIAYTSYVFKTLTITGSLYKTSKVMLPGMHRYNMRSEMLMHHYVNFDVKIK